MVGDKMTVNIVYHIHSWQRYHDNAVITNICIHTIMLTITYTHTAIVFIIMYTFITALIFKCTSVHSCAGIFLK